MLYRLCDILSAANSSNQALLTELDGAPCSDLQFTALCLPSRLSNGGSYSREQRDHLTAFVSLRHWLSRLLQLRPFDSKEAVSQTTTRIRCLLQELVLRMLNQTERRAPRQTALMASALHQEAICLAALLCELDPATAPRFYMRLSGLVDEVGLAVPLVRFLTQHAEAMGQAAVPLFEKLLGPLLDAHLRNLFLCLS